MRESWRRWHVWLGWITGVPLVLWSISGLIMASRPLAEIRSEMYLRAPQAASGHFIAPDLSGRTVTSLQLINGPAGPRWTVTGVDGDQMAFDGASGQPVPRLSAAQAAAAARAGYKQPSGVTAVTFVDRRTVSHEFPRAVDAWRVTFDDGMRIYVDAWGGQVLVARSRWWSVYDAAWAVHIMDIQGRDDPNNPWIIMLGLLTAALTLFAVTLLPKATRKMLRSAAPADEI